MRNRKYKPPTDGCMYIPNIDMSNIASTHTLKIETTTLLDGRCIFVAPAEYVKRATYTHYQEAASHIIYVIKKDIFKHLLEERQSRIKYLENNLYRTKYMKDEFSTIKHKKYFLEIDKLKNESVKIYTKCITTNKLIEFKSESITNIEP